MTSAIPGGNRGAHQRQRHAPEGRETGDAAGPRHFFKRHVHTEEGTTAEEVDEGKRIQRHDECRAPIAMGGKDSGLGSGHELPEMLDGAAESQEVGVDIGQHVGRHRQGKDQGAFPQPATGKLHTRHQPGGRDAQDQRDDRHAAGQRDGVEQQLGNASRPEAAPNGWIGREGLRGDIAERQQE